MKNINEAPETAMNGTSSAAMTLLNNKSTQIDKKSQTKKLAKELKKKIKGFDKDPELEETETSLNT